MKSLLRKDEICKADEIHFVDEIKSVNTPPKAISSQCDFIHRRWIYSVCQDGFS
ncbi:MAG: hypothetical protein IJM97_05190 [Clostridia bacterium]|nr:hypothetical protein [Clostridia bacterium]